MRKRVRYVLVIATFVVGAMVTTQGAAFASPSDGPAFGDNGEFLCPAVGNSTAADANGRFGELPEEGTYTFLPGNNQAGAHANSKALNTENPAPGNVPGNGNSDWSPIWPGDNPNPGNG